MEKNLPKMELDLGHIDERESFSWDEGFGIETPEGEQAPCRVRVEAAVARTGSRYLLDAGITCTLKVVCSRCLEPFDQDIDAGFKLVFERGEKVKAPEGIEEDDFVLLSQSAEFCYDIFPRVREAVLLELPIKYLCSAECAGICPGCGANLNIEKCGCKGSEGDPRWDSLKKLLNGQDDS